jgi:hypothetical protein
MVLPNGATAARRIANGSYWLEADTGEIAWDTGGNEVWTASSPGWQPIQAGFESDSPASVSSGWLAWVGSGLFLVHPPGGPTQLVVPDGAAVTGGWLILGEHSEQPVGYSPTKLEAIRVSDLR